ncbi:hypothetical protein HYV79_04635 [Candidatus Woesearchaeota archaeon]|nr:hypothetical protein [Candidatus Woesearchaeota archaeon]
MKKTILIFISVFLLILAACAKAPKDCGNDAQCIEESILKGEMATATLTEESKQTGASQGTMTVLVKSEGLQEGKHVVYQEIQNVNVQLPQPEALPESATEGEKKQQELLNSVMKEMGALVQKMQGTWVRCRLTPESLKSGIEQALNDAMEQSLDPTTLKPVANSACEGTFLTVMADMLRAVQNLLQQALAPLAN